MTIIKSRRLRPRAHRFALESRQLFDGAGLAETAAHAETASDLVHHENATEPAKALDIPHATTATPATQNGAASNIYVIDQHISGWQSLVDQVPQGSQVVIIDEKSSGLSQLADALKGETNLSAIHILSHGASDTITLGTDVLTADNLSAYSSQLSAIGASLSDSGDILLYGCDISAQDNAFISRFAVLTQADVAASSDMTGSAALSGDWALESHTGSIEANSFAFDYDGLLAGPDVTAPEKGITVAEPSTLNAAGADTATLSGWEIGTTDATETVTVTVSLSNSDTGTLSDSQTSNSTLSMTGTASEAQAWLNSITFKSSDVELGNTAAASKLNVTVKDSSGVSTSKSIDVTVTPSNDPVSVANATQSVSEIDAGGTTITTVSLNAIDAEVSKGTQQPVQIVYGLTALPEYGYLTLNGDRMGVGSIFTQQDVIDGKVKYVHTATGADQNTADGFTAMVNDGATPKAQSDTVRVTLDITPQNQAPTISGSGVVFEGQPSNAQHTGNVGQYIAADGGGDPGDTTLTVTITSLPANGTLYFDGRAVTVGQTFNYAERNLLTYANNGSENQGVDSFGVRVTDQGGGTGTPASTDGTITLRVQPVDDDPTLDNVTLHAQVDDFDNAVTLTSDMIGASDVDSTDNHLSFIVDDSKITHGYLLLDGYRLSNGGTFTMQDILDGKVQYVQYTSASTTDQTDSFNFVVVDNTAALRWNTDGTTYSRIGGIYTSGTETLTSFTFTIGLALATGGGTGTVPERVTTITNRDSAWAGVDFTSGNARGEVKEGGTIVLNGTSGDFSDVPGLSYTATGVDASQVVYTFLGFANGATGGDLQKSDGNGNWVSLGEYSTFTQADLDSGKIRFQHDGGETFVYAAQFSVSAGLTTTDSNGAPVTDIWTPTLNIYVTPVNDLPVVTGSSSTVIAEGETAYLTTGQISITDPDDANSGNGLESSAVIKDNGTNADNYAYNNDATGANALKFTVTSLPAGGTLQYKDGSQWINVTLGQTLDASLLTASTSTTGLRFVSDGSEVRATTFTVSATDRWGAASASDATVKIQITNVNDAPQIAQDPTKTDPTVQAGAPNLIGGTPANNSLHVTEGSYSQITSSMLQAYDPDSSAMQVQYTITSAPTHGSLAYSKDGVNFSAIGTGSSFTQQDVNNGYIYYLNDGTEGSGNSEIGTPNTPDDKFTFRISDGDKEQAGNEFWIYTDPTNDAPVVTAPSGIKNIASATASSNALPGFSVSDADLTTVSEGETDYLQVTVRLLHQDGSAFVGSEYSDVTLGYATGSGAVLSASHGGQHDYLVLSGTRAQVNAALAGLTVTFSSDRNATYQVQTIADDRLRDASGALATGANGGTVNQPAMPGKGAEATAVDATEYNWYSDAVPTKSGNLSAASVTIRASEINDPGTLTVTNPDRTVYEDRASFIGGNIVVGDIESAAFNTPVTVTITAPSGALGIGGAGLNTSAIAGVAGSQAVAISGDNSGTLILTGRASDIEALLNDAALGLTWQSDADVNHDLNGAATGDVTITLHLNDGDSHIGDTAQVDPADVKLNLIIVPVNDAPVVTATGDTLYLNNNVTNGNAVGGFAVSDVDYSDGIVDGETDFIQVTVRITDATGKPLSASDYNNGTISSITIGSTAATSVTVDSTYTGNNAALVIRGTLDQVNAYLAALTVSMTGSALSNADKAWRVEVIADDRLRDSTGALTSASSANGGQNDAVTGVAAVPTTAVDPYATLPSDLTQNVSSAYRNVFPSDVNDPATISVTDPDTFENSTTVTLPAITVTDPDADSASLTVKVTLPGGFTFKTIGGTGGTLDSGGVGGGSFTLTGTLSQINDRLANLTVNLPTNAGVTATDWNGAFNVTVVVNDNANHGSRPATLTNDTNNPGANPGDVSYADETSAALVTTRTFTVTVKPVNDAPVVVGGATQTLGAVSEDTSAAAITGDTITNLFANKFSDAKDQVNNTASAVSGGSSSDSFWGVAINSLTVNDAQGEWQYSIDGGNSWTAIGNRTDSNALLLDKDAKVRFVPAADYFGTPASLAVRLVETDDNGDSNLPGVTFTSGDTTSITAYVGSSRFSSAITLSTSVTNVNDRPTIGATPLTMTEDTPAGQTLASLLGSYGDTTDNQTAITGGGNASGAIGYVAIVGNTTDTKLGHWEYSTNGTTWTAVGTTYSETSALVLLGSTQLRFVPLADYNGAVPGGLSVRVSDSTSSADTGVSAAGTTQDLQSAFNSGQTSHWSTAQSISMSITAVKDTVDDAATTHAGVAKSIDVLGNDSFTNNDKTITAVTDGTRGKVVIDNGKVIYTPDTTSYVGTDTFTYTVTSGGITETATVTIAMTNVAPVTQGENVSTPEDTTLTSTPAQNLLLNDSDADGDALTVKSFTVDGQTRAAGQTADLTGYGKLTINSDGSYTFEPVADWNGTVPTVTYQVVDGRTNGATTAQLKIAVTPAQDAFDDSQTGHGRDPLVIDVFGNDTFKNDDKAITRTTNGTHGKVTVSSGKVIYTLSDNYVGTDTFTYTVTSGGVTETATVTVTMTNAAPVVANVTDRTNEDATLNSSAAKNLLKGATDPELDDLTVTGFRIGSVDYRAGDTATIAGKGKLTIKSDGSYTFTPVADWNGSVPEVTFTVTDGRSNGDRTATLNIIVDPVKDTVDDTASTHAGVAKTIDVLGNDSFEDTTGREVTGVTQGTHGTVTFTKDGVTYKPADASYVGDDTFTYTVTSGGVTETATVTVTMTNAAPVVANVTDRTNEDATLNSSAAKNLLKGATDAEGDALTVKNFTVDGQTTAAGQSVTINGKGTLTINSDGSYSFIPLADWNGTVPEVTFTVTDGRSNGDRTATLSITVDPVKDTVDDTATTHAGVPVTIDVLGNDDFTNNDKSITAVTDGTHGKVTIDNGKVIYTPGTTSYVGTDAFTYTVTSGGVTETATVIVTMTNAAPVVANVTDLTNEDATLNSSAEKNLLKGATDAEGDALTVKNFTVDGQTTAAGQSVTINGKGTLTINSDGSYSFIPLADWNGTVPEVTFTVTDGRSNGDRTATLSITVDPVKDTVDDTATTHAGVPVTIDVLGNDDFTNNDKSITAVTDGTHGKVTIDNGKVIYTPGTTSYVGTDAFTYTVTSGGVTETATVTVTMTNAAPVVANVTDRTNEDATLNSSAEKNLLKGATDAEGDALTVKNFTVDGQTTAAGQSATINGKGTLTINSDGSYSFIPLADWNGTVPEVTFTVTDGRSNGDRTATLSITVDPVKDTVDDAATTHAGVPVNIDVLTNDSFEDVTGREVTGVTQGTHGTVTFTRDGVTYKPADPAYVGTDTFTYIVTSGGITETATVTVIMTNTIPVLKDVTDRINEDATLNSSAEKNLLKNAADAEGDALTVKNFTVDGQTTAAGQSVTINGTGNLTINSDGSYSFEPVADWNGIVPAITYTVSDGKDGGTATATLNITVTTVVDIQDDIASTHAGVPVTIDAINNDSFVNGDKAIASVTQGAHGSVTIENGQLLYKPNTGYVGTDTFTYTVTSGGVTETGTVSVVMINTVPVAQGESVNTPEDIAVQGKLLANDHDADNDPLHIADFTVGGKSWQPGDTALLAGVGALTIHRDGSYLFTPVADWNGVVPVTTYTVSDGNDGGITTATLAIAVTPVVDVKNDSSITHAGVPVTVDALTNDRFSNADRTITGVTNGAHGAVTIVNGKVIYQPNTGYVGKDTFTYTVTSGGVTETAKVTLEVTNVPPVAVVDKASTLPDTPVSGNLLTNDRDADNDPLHVANVTVSGVTYNTGETIVIPGQGTLAVNRDGSYLFTPASGWSGFTPVINYTLSDGNDGGAATGELHLLVSPVAEAWVKEAGLIDMASGSQTTTGAITVLSLESVESLTIGGQTLTLAQLQAMSVTRPVDIVTSDGVLSLTGFQTEGKGHATLQYRFTLAQAVNQPGETTTREEIRFSVNGQQTRTPGLLRVNILNDVPVAAADDNSIDQDRGQQAASGNVYGNDAIGADGTATNGPVSAVSSVNLQHAGAVGSASLGEFGSLTLDANGNYRYELNRSNSRVASLDANATLSEVFTYTITDADGNTSQAQLTIVIHGVTAPLSVRQGEQHFPHNYTNYELKLDQPYSPGLFILPAIYGVYSDQFTREVELNRKITELGRGMNDNGTPVLEDGILFTRWVNTTLQRSVSNTFAATGIGSQLSGDHFSRFSLNKSVQPAPVLEKAPERPPVNERVNERTTVQQEQGERTSDTRMVQAQAAASGVVIVPEAPARPGAPSLAAQMDALARNRAATPEPVIVGGVTPQR
ncbi:Ig-like domain-containing protein [Dryocola sp. BD613]|uniref:Ig-like domain-containing protein n=1 Tax=Dryocola sp. BD613 TaxID=3133272 RepID=UPI003F4FFE51